MKTGIELIAIERREQIEKHGWSLEHDKDYARGQLLQAAEFCLDQARRKQTGIGVDIQTWPEGWLKHFEEKIRSKSVIQQYIVAGAFYLAEHDRTGDDYKKITIQISAEIDRLIKTGDYEFCENCDLVIDIDKVIYDSDGTPLCRKCCDELLMNAEIEEAE